jgi:hypothetical protein
MQYTDQVECPVCHGVGLIREVPEIGGWRKARPPRRIDVSVEYHGTIVTFGLLSTAARAFVADEVKAEPWQFLGGRLCVDRRCADALVAGMVEAGLAVQIRRAPLR